jgi:hypothetical protein
MELLNWIMVIGSCVYLTIAFREVYETKTWIGSALKALFTSLVYLLISLVIVFGIFIVACFIFAENTTIS